MSQPLLEAHASPAPGRPWLFDRPGDRPGRFETVCPVAAGSLVPPGMAIGRPARVKHQIQAGTDAVRIPRTDADVYIRLMERHRAGTQPVP